MLQGVPLFHIEELLNEAVEDCIRDLHPVTIPVTLSSPSSHRCTLPRPASPAAATSSPATHNACPQQVHPAAANPATLCPSAVNREDLRAANGGGFETDQYESSPNVKTKSPPVLEDEGGSLLRAGDDGGDLKSEKVSIFQAVRDGDSSVKTASSALDAADPPRGADHFLHLLKAGQVLAGSLNGFLPPLRKPAASATASLHRRVALSSRHLQSCGVVGQHEPSGLSEEPRDSRYQAVKESVYSDCCVPVQPQEHSSRTCHSVSVAVKPEQSSAAGLRCVVLPEEAQVLSHECDDMMAWAREAARRQLLHGSLPKSVSLPNFCSASVGVLPLAWVKVFLIYTEICMCFGTAGY